MNAPTPAELRRAHQAIHAARQELEQLAETIHALAPRVLDYDHTQTEQDHAIAQLIAWAHGGPPPPLTPPAQAILARAARRP